VIARIKNLVFLLRHGRFQDIAEKIRHRMSSDTRSYCLRRDLSVPFQAPDAKVPITVREIRDDDKVKIFDLNRPGISPAEKKELVRRLEHLNADIPTCYVAVSDDGTPAYVQWLMGATLNDRIQSYFNGIFPVLAPDEALLENAFTLEAFRGKGIMPAAMARIAEKGSQIGARWVITFVEESNVPSLKGCKRSGFEPYMFRHERWHLFRRTLEFTRLPENTPYPFDLP